VKKPAAVALKDAEAETELAKNALNVDRVRVIDYIE
jgi:hypothetical protein